MTSLHGESSMKRFTPEVAAYMAEAIAETGGREVFFAGGLDPVGMVVAARVCARGKADAVPALFEQLSLREVVIHNHPSGDLDPSEADLELAGMYSAHGHGVYIVDNEVTAVYVVVEPFLPNNVSPLDPKELDAFFAPNGDMARILPQYEVRSQQKEMMHLVARAFNQEGIGVVEAPTGVGKTLAYLLPAVLWALRNKERVVISTRTINLQEQLIFKDIPLLVRCLELSFNACLVKGRGNYICRRRLERAFSEETLFDDESLKEQLDALTSWVEETKDGSRADLPFVPPRELWERVCSEADTCTMGRCPQAQQCFVTKARKEIAKADILVVNHHMLFSDIALKREAGDFSAVAILPVYQRVIFDEAHSVEDSATEYFGVNASKLQAMATLGRFLRIDRGRERGLIPFLKAKLVKDCPQLDVKEFEVIQDLIEGKLLPQLAVCREKLDGVFSALRDLSAMKCGQMGRDIKWRLTPAVLQDPDLRALHNDVVLPCVQEIHQFVGFCQKLLGRIKDIPPNPHEVESPIAVEVAQLRAFSSRMERIGNVLAESTSEELAENTVRWIEIDARREQYIRVCRCPLEVGPPLAEWVFEKLKTVVMTSATLTVQKRFDYLASRTGLDRIPQHRMETLMLSSPFDFQEQALFCIPGDMPVPTASDFLDSSIEAIRTVLHFTKGHAFVLFTSFYALDYTFRHMEAELRAQGITPLKQGGATRTQLLNRFRSDTTSVLFATDSFWEGVDVAGESLQCVILPKLPFRVPTEPILEARAEAIEAAGGNPFMAYSVPQAVIKFRQGFGRLIRRRSDRGVIVVLDQRIISKYYGRIFLASLPDIRIARGPSSTVFKDLELFFSELREDTPC